MPRRKVALIACAAVLACLGFVLTIFHSAPHLDGRIESAMVNKDWFALRAAIATVPAGEVPSIVRARLARAFRQDAEAIRYAKEAVVSRHSWEIGDAHGILSAIYDRDGRYGEALDEALAARAARKQNAARDPLENLEKLWQAIRAWPAPTVLARKRSILRGKHDDDGIEMPVTVNGKRASYLLDTGTTTSTITPEEAARLDLDILPVPGFVVSDANEEDVPANAVLVKQLTIGGFRLANVLFLVESDDTGGQGIIGMNVLELLETVRWTDRGRIEIGFPSPAFDIASANLCLNGAEGPLIDSLYRGKPILVYFDSGGDNVEFLSRFGSDFPDSKRAGKPAEIHRNGSASTRTWHGLNLPLIEIELGGSIVHLQDAILLTEEPADTHEAAHVWLGLDALSRAPHVSLDFRAMLFSLQ